MWIAHNPHLVRLFRNRVVAPGARCRRMALRSRRSRRPRAQWRSRAAIVSAAVVRCCKAASIESTEPYFVKEWAPGRRAPGGRGSAQAAYTALVNLLPDAENHV